jgi:predicted transcriptional regulator
MTAETDNTRRLTVQIVSAHVANNTVALGDLPGLIAQVHGALTGMGRTVEPVAERPQPAVPVKKSVTPDYIVCLEDGKKLKMLKRHLSSSYDMTPDQYRERWVSRRTTRWLLRPMRSSAAPWPSRSGLAPGGQAQHRRRSP